MSEILSDLATRESEVGFGAALGTRQKIAYRWSHEPRATV
jgi:hypothetical protein